MIIHISILYLDIFYKKNLLSMNQRLLADNSLRSTNYENIKDQSLLIAYTLFSVMFWIIILFFINGIYRLKAIKETHNSYSVVSVARNEEERIGFLLEGLRQLEYDDFEIILVDDASTDNTYKLMQAFCKKTPLARCYRLEEKSTRFKGKKAALKFAVEHAGKDIIVFTDADCTPPSNWLKSFNHFMDSSITMSIGASVEVGSKFFMSVFRWFSTSVFASTVGVGRPMSCSGRNMAVRRDFIINNNIYERIRNYVSGDDKLTLKQVVSLNGKVTYNYLSMVKAYESSDYFNRVKRYTGKFKMSNVPYQVLSVCIFFYYVLSPVFMVVSIIKGSLMSAALFLSSILITALLFYHLIYASCKKHGFNFSLKHYPYMIVFPYIVISFSLMGNTGNWKWK